MRMSERWLDLYDTRRISATASHSCGVVQDRHQVDACGDGGREVKEPRAEPLALTMGYLAGQLTVASGAQTALPLRIGRGRRQVGQGPEEIIVVLYHRLTFFQSTFSIQPSVFNRSRTSARARLRR